MAKLTLRVGAIGRWPRNRAKCVSKRTHFGTKKQDIRLYLCTRQLTHLWWSGRTAVQVATRDID